MQIDQRKAGVLLNYIYEAIKVITALIYTPVMLRLLGQSEYGLYQLSVSTVSYLSLISFGFASAYIRYYARYRAQSDEHGIARLNGIFMVVFCCMAAMCLACGSIMAANTRVLFGSGLSAAELDKARTLLFILVLNMTITFPNSVFDCHIMAHEQFLFQKLLRIAQALLNPFLVLPLLIMGHGSIAVVAVSTGLTLGVFFANILFCRRRLRMRFVFKKMQFSLLREMGVFTFFIFLNQIINQVNWSVDNFLLGRMSGTAAVAVYGIGSQINAMYIQSSTAVSSVFSPRINRIVAGGGSNDELTRLMIKVGRVQFLILGLVLLGFVFFGQPFIRLWAGKEYYQSYIVALLLMSPMTVPLVQNLGLEIQRAKNMHRARSVVYFCLAVCNVIISIFFIRRWGCVGAAAGTAIALTLGNIVFMNWYYHKKIGLNMISFWKSMAGFLPAIAIMCAAGIVISRWIAIESWGMLLVCAAIYTAVYCAVMWCVGMNDYEKQLVRGVFKKLKITARHS